MLLNHNVVKHLRFHQASVPDKAFGSYWSSPPNDDIVLKLFPDILVYNLIIYVVLLVALWSKRSDKVRRLLTKSIRVDFPLDNSGSFRIYSVADILMALAITFLVLFQFFYFFYDHAWENESNSTRPTSELAARSMGQVTNLLTGLLLLPVSRNSVWSILFGVSYKDLLEWHKYVAAAMVVSTILHAVLWCFAFTDYGYFPEEIFTIVGRKFHDYNFTVPLATLTFILVIICMGVLTWQPFRKTHYDVFYLAHHVSLLLFFVMLWHAVSEHSISHMSRLTSYSYCALRRPCAGTSSLQV